jgi:hypothetical protein
MIRSNLQLFALSAALLFSLFNVRTTCAQQTATAVDSPLNTLVLIEDNARNLHVGADLDAVYQYWKPNFGKIGAASAAQAAQKASDVTLEPLLALAPKNIVRDAVVQAIEQTLARHGMTALSTRFQDKPNAAQFQRFPKYDNVKRWVLVQFDDSHDITVIPLALTGDLRQVRLSLRLSVYSVSDGEIRKRISLRNILLFSPPVDATTSHLALEHWGTDRATALDVGLRTAVSELVKLAISDEDFGESATKDDFVDLLAHRGPQRIRGRLIRYRDGNALIINQSGNLLVVPAVRML